MSDATKQANEALLSLVKAAEGFHHAVQGTYVTAVPYLCPALFWTIGYGHLCMKDAQPITMEQALAFLATDLLVARAGVMKYTSVALTPFQLAALTSFAFNLGIGRYRASTLRSVLNRGEYNNVPDELRKWVYGGARKLPGLVLRREAEARLWARSN